MIPLANLIQLNSDILEVHIPSQHCLSNCCRAFCELAHPHRSPSTQWREQPVAWWLSQFPPPCQNTKQKQSKPCFYSLQANSRNHYCVTSAVLETYIYYGEKNRTLVWFLFFPFCLERWYPDFSQGITTLWGCSVCSSVPVCEIQMSSHFYKALK